MPINSIYRRILCVSALLLSCGCAKQSVLLSGQVTSPKGPVQNAKIFLIAYKNEGCAKASSLKESTSSACPEEKAAEAVPDSEGNYQFKDVAAGWYKIKIERDLGQVERGYGAYMDSEDHSDFSISYSFIKGTDGMSANATALTDSFLVSGNGNLKKDFEFKKY